MASLIAFHCEEGLRRSSSHETRHFLLPSVPAAATAATTTTTATTATATTATTTTTTTTTTTATTAAAAGGEAARVHRHRHQVARREFRVRRRRSPLPAGLRQRLHATGWNRRATRVERIWGLQASNGTFD